MIAVWKFDLEFLLKVYKVDPEKNYLKTAENIHEYSWHDFLNSYFCWGKMKVLDTGCTFAVANMKEEGNEMMWRLQSLININPTFHLLLAPVFKKKKKKEEVGLFSSFCDNQATRKS